MKKLTRWTFNGLTVLSLLLSVMVAVLWVRSRHAYDDITYFAPAGVATARSYSCEAVVGEFAIHVETAFFPPSRREDYLAAANGYHKVGKFAARHETDQNPYWSVARFQGEQPQFRPQTFKAPWTNLYGINGASFQRWSIYLPFWLPFVFFLLLPLAWLLLRLRRFAKRLKIKGGFCPTCGYNLTGNVSGRCPECGAAFERSRPTVVTSQVQRSPLCCRACPPSRRKSRPANRRPRGRSSRRPGP